MRLLRDAALMAVARLTSLGCVAALNVLTSRALGPEGRGLYALPTIDCGLAATLILGMSSAISYFMLNKGAARGIARAGIAASVVLTFAGAGITIAIGLSNHHVWALKIALAYLPFYALLTLASGFCIGSNRVRYWGLISVAVPVMTLACVTAGFSLFGRNAGVAVAGWLSGTAVVAVAASLLAFRHARAGAGASIDVGEFLRFAMKAGVVNVVTLLNYRVDLYIVAMLAPLSTLGLYAVAVAGAEAAVALAHAFSLAMQPRVGSLGRTEAAAFTARCVRNNLLFATVLSLTVGTVAGPAVRLLFGPAFAPIVPVLRVLLVGVVALSIGTVIANFFMLNAGRAVIPLSAGVFSTLVCAAISLPLVPRIGMMGAALGTAISYVLSQVVSVAWFCRDTGIHPARVLLIDAADVAAYKQIVLSRFSHAG